METSELYNTIGDNRLQSIISDFYDAVGDDITLKRMFPENKQFSKHFLYLFLKQVFGGPLEYKEMRGHGMMRKRHDMFKIGWEERNAWLRLFYEALDKHGINEDHPAREKLEEYLEGMATKIMNAVQGNMQLVDNQS